MRHLVRCADIAVFICDSWLVLEYVASSLEDQLRIIAKHAYSRIAVRAQQISDHSGLVIVIYEQPRSVGWVTADGTYT